jgi:hypothetical protein
VKARLWRRYVQPPDATCAADELASRRLCVSSTDREAVGMFHNPAQHLEHQNTNEHPRRHHATLKPLAPMRRRANDHVRALAMTSSRIWMPFIDFNTILTFPQVGKETRVVLEVDIGPRFEFIACLFAATTRSPPGCPLDITPRVCLGYASGRSFLLILILTVPFAS